MLDIYVYKLRFYYFNESSLKKHLTAFDWSRRLKFCSENAIQKLDANKNRYKSRRRKSVIMADKLFLQSVMEKLTSMMIDVNDFEKKALRPSSKRCTRAVVKQAYSLQMEVSAGLGKSNIRVQCNIPAHAAYCMCRYIGAQKPAAHRRLWRLIDIEQQLVPSLNAKGYMSNTFFVPACQHIDFYILRMVLLIEKS